MDKYIRGGNLVGILYSPGFGAGWSTWNPEYPDMAFDPGMIDLIANNEWDKAQTYATLKWPEASLEGFKNLSVTWLPQGTRFRVVEYDGAETIEIRDKIDWSTA